VSNLTQELDELKSIINEVKSLSLDNNKKIESFLFNIKDELSSSFNENVDFQELNNELNSGSEDENEENEDDNKSDILENEDNKKIFLGEKLKEIIKNELESSV
jgi:hypothetical protein